jgi:hypothetical protein
MAVVNNHPREISSLYFYCGVVAKYFKESSGLDKGLKLGAKICENIIYFKDKMPPQVFCVSKAVLDWFGGTIAAMSAYKLVFVDGFTIWKDVQKLNHVEKRTELWKNVHVEHGAVIRNAGNTVQTDTVLEDDAEINAELRRHICDFAQDFFKIILATAFNPIFRAKEAMSEGWKALWNSYKEGAKVIGDTNDAMHTRLEKQRLIERLHTSNTNYTLVQAQDKAIIQRYDLTDGSELESIHRLKMIKAVTSVIASVLAILSILGEFGIISIAAATFTPYILLFSTISIVTCIWSQLSGEVTTAKMRAAQVIGVQ